MSRVQLALNVGDLDASIEFYTKLFKTPPAKVRENYANFAIAEPPLKLVLFAGTVSPVRSNHVGVEVESTDEVAAARPALRRRISRATCGSRPAVVMPSRTRSGSRVRTTRGRSTRCWPTLRRSPRMAPAAPAQATNTRETTPSRPPRAAADRATARSPEGPPARRRGPERTATSDSQRPPEDRVLPDRLMAG